MTIPAPQSVAIPTWGDFPTWQPDFGAVDHTQPLLVLPSANEVTASHDGGGARGDTWGAGFGPSDQLQPCTGLENVPVVGASGIDPSVLSMVPYAPAPHPPSLPMGGTYLNNGDTHNVMTTTSDGQLAGVDPASTSMSGLVDSGLLAGYDPTQPFRSHDAVDDWLLQTQPGMQTDNFHSVATVYTEVAQTGMPPKDQSPSVTGSEALSVGDIFDMDKFIKSTGGADLALDTPSLLMTAAKRSSRAGSTPGDGVWMPAMDMGMSRDTKRQSSPSWTAATSVSEEADDESTPRGKKDRLDHSAGPHSPLFSGQGSILDAESLTTGSEAVPEHADADTVRPLLKFFVDEGQDPDEELFFSLGYGNKTKAKMDRRIAVSSQCVPVIRSEADHRNSAEGSLETFSRQSTLFCPRPQVSMSPGQLSLNKLESTYKPAHGRC